MSEHVVNNHAAFIWSVADPVLVALIGLVSVVGTIAPLVDGSAVGLLVPVFGFLAVLLTRTILEATMVFFTMARDIRVLAQRRPTLTGPHLPT
jgi:hypothetical protein